MRDEDDVREAIYTVLNIGEGNTLVLPFQCRYSEKSIAMTCDGGWKVTRNERQEVEECEEERSTDSNT